MTFVRLQYLMILLLLTLQGAMAGKLHEFRVLDMGYLQIHFKDGEVIRRDDGTGNCAFMGHCHHADGSRAVHYGKPLNIAAATNTRSWNIHSEDDLNYRRKRTPSSVFRKSKLNGMTISHYDTQIKPRGDYVYETTMEHHLYLKLPYPLQQGATYTVRLNGRMNSDMDSFTFTYDIFSSVSESIHVNLYGYTGQREVKTADLYHWMGDGGFRDYTSFEGNKVYLLNVETGQKQEAGEVTFWKKRTGEANGYDFTSSDVWNADIKGIFPEGTYRLAVEGVGCSNDFLISPEIYKLPMEISAKGYFYMRLGQQSPDISPRPREPFFIPGVDGTKVYKTNLHPYHPAWEDIRRRRTDPWDHPDEWAPYSTDEEASDSWGGYSDAYDWDKRLQHVFSIYDMLLPFILSGGGIPDDDLGIAESGNGIPDILDGARVEVDAWLRMRDGKGYAHGRTCPYSEVNRILFQSAPTAVAAWANALNAAMLAEAFRLSGHEDLMQQYLDSATVAFHYADNLSDKMLDNYDGTGTGRVRGRDFRMMAAAYLYNLTGKNFYEDIMYEESVVTSSDAVVIDVRNHNQLYGIVAYLSCPHTINYPELWRNMKKAVIKEAHALEAGFSQIRPSRRSTCNDNGYFWTMLNVQRTIVACHFTTDSAEKNFFLNALMMEADWSLGRNPANIIQMTTASTVLESRRSVEFAYTSGYNDGVPGLHPGHTPYWNIVDWAPDMIMGRPGWMVSQSYPAGEKWPRGELFFNTDYVWSHTEFTPQQTMRGKMALYTWLYAVERIKKTTK
jgi:endoglucanase